MARYFRYFPKTFYYPKLDSKSLDTITNLVVRFKFEAALKENSVAYYQYDIKDSDTPEIIASKFYDSPEKHWAVLLINDILDPQWEWPMDQATTIKFIEEKYSVNANSSLGQTGVTWAKGNIKNYFILQTRTLSTGGITIDKTETDANTYANTSIYTTGLNLLDGNSVIIELTKETRTYYDYEFDTNEEKRKIKLLKKEFIYPLDQEIKRLSSTTGTTN
jgi:hypothetical protein